MKTIQTNNYPIYFDGDAYIALNAFILEKQPSKIIVLTDSNTAEFCLPIFLAKIKTSYPILFYSIPNGEIYKTIDTSTKVWDFLSENKIDRDSLLVNLGGGVVSDLGGFVAGTYQRGISFVNIPTSLLAMVDASIGGKTGVDLGVLKNQIGILHNPEIILIDTFYLKTLPKNEFFSGYAEMLKHGLIYSVDYWKKLSTSKPDELKNLDSFIYESIEIKNTIVAQDPKEKGVRKTLNFGHTLGHAIESHFLADPIKKTLLHGEAIAIGIVLAASLSHEMLNFSSSQLEEITTAYISCFSKVMFTKNDIDSIIELLQFDKKNKNGNIHFVLLFEIGNPKMDCIVSNELIFKAFEYYQESI